MLEPKSGAKSVQQMRAESGSEKFGGQTPAELLQGVTQASDKLCRHYWRTDHCARLQLPLRCTFLFTTEPVSEQKCLQTAGNCASFLSTSAAYATRMATSKC